MSGNSPFDTFHRKVGLEVEAIQWQGDAWVAEYVQESLDRTHMKGALVEIEGEGEDVRMFIPDLGSGYYAHIGDWIVVGKSGGVGVWRDRDFQFVWGKKENMNNE